MINKVRKRLLKEAEKDYKKFTASLIPNIDNVLGVRLPTLRKIAKEIFQSEYREDFLKCKDCEYMEEVMLQGMTIAHIKDESILDYIKDFVPRINNWAVCDSFCTGLKYTNKHKEEVFKFIKPYFNSEKEYEKRFAYVMLLSYFTDDIDRALKLIDEFEDDRYYARMAVAWAVSVLFVKHPDETLEYLKYSKLDKWTYNKSLQKIRESLRVDKKTKELLKTFVR